MTGTGLDTDHELMARWQAELVPTETLLRELSIQRAARELGVTVMLSGWGGDELASFNGRGHLAWLAARGRWPTIVRHLSRSSRRVAADPRGRVQSALMELRTGLDPLLPATVRDRRADPLAPVGTADRRVLELCLSFPEHLWLHEGFTRWVFRAAVDPLLPRELTWGVPKHEPGLIHSLRRSS